MRNERRFRPVKVSMVLPSSKYGNGGLDGLRGMDRSAPITAGEHDLVHGAMTFPKTGLAVGEVEPPQPAEAVVETEGADIVEAIFESQTPSLQGFRVVR